MTTKGQGDGARVELKMALELAKLRLLLRASLDALEPDTTEHFKDLFRSEVRAALVAENEDLREDGAPEDRWSKLRARLRTASPNDRTYERPCNWDDAEALLAERDALCATFPSDPQPEPVVDRATGKPVPGPWTQELVESMGLHHRTAALVNGFAYHLAEKLRRSEIKYGWADGWASDEWEEECRRQLHAHAAKGDPLDVAAYAAFCWHHKWTTAAPDQVNGESWHQQLRRLVEAKDYTAALALLRHPAPGSTPLPSHGLTPEEVLEAVRENERLKASAFVDRYGRELRCSEAVWDELRHTREKLEARRTRGIADHMPSQEWLDRKVASDPDDSDSEAR